MSFAHMHASWLNPGALLITITAIMNSQIHREQNRKVMDI